MGAFVGERWVGAADNRLGESRVRFRVTIPDIFLATLMVAVTYSVLIRLHSKDWATTLQPRAMLGSMLMFALLACVVLGTWLTLMLTGSKLVRGVAFVLVLGLSTCGLLGCVWILGLWLGGPFAVPPLAVVNAAWMQVVFMVFALSLATGVLFVPEKWRQIQKRKDSKE